MTGELMEEAKPVKTLPRHVAVIMDGNGRWAKNRHMPRVEGHRRGVSAVESCTEAARRAGIKALTLFAFSSENWKRPEEEVSALMRLFGLMLVNQREKLVKNDIRLHVAGDVSAFSDPLRQAIEETERATEHCSAMQLTICANYGGRWDIVQAVRSILKEEPLAASHPAMIDEELISRYLALPWAFWKLLLKKWISWTFPRNRLFLSVRLLFRSLNMMIRTVRSWAPICRGRRYRSSARKHLL